MAADVCGYLSNSALDDFISEQQRVLKEGGYLLIMYGNELFDMFALNSGTVNFFEKYFNLDV